MGDSIHNWLKRLKIRRGTDKALVDQRPPTTGVGGRCSTSALPILSTILISCTGASISPISNTTPELERLINANQKQVSLEIRYPENSKTFGWQYLLILFPLAQVEVQDPIQELKTAFTKSLAINGYKITNLPQAYKLEITLTSLSLNGYDYLFFRRPACDAQMEAKLFSPNGDLLGFTAVDENSADFTKFAFEPELSSVLRETLEKSATLILAKLRL